MSPRTLAPAVGASVMALGLLGAAACGPVIRGSGTVVDKDVSIGSFVALEVSNAFVVTLDVGSAPAVTVHADDNVMPEVDVGVSGSTLHLGLAQGTAIEGATLEADVTITDLTAVTLSGASRVTLPDGFDADRLTTNLSGAAHLEGAGARLGTLTVSESGAAIVSLTGTADALTLEMSGASHFGSERMNAGSVEASLSGASAATVAAAETLAYDLSGASSLTYFGDPTITQDQVSGGSAATKGG